MIEIDSMTIGSKTFQYIKIDMEKAPLILLKGPVGFVMCGYLDIGTARKLGDVAVRVTGVNDLDSLISAKVENITEKAAEIGIKPGQIVSDILSYL